MSAAVDVTPRCVCGDENGASFVLSDRQSEKLGFDRDAWKWTVLVALWNKRIPARESTLRIHPVCQMGPEAVYEAEW